MDEVLIRFDRDEVKMASSLLLLVIYYPDFPPLKAFTNLGFQGRQDLIVLVEDGLSLFTEVENCTQAQLLFLQNKLQEIPEFSSSIVEIGNNKTRITIYPSACDA